MALQQAGEIVSGRVSPSLHSIMRRASEYSANESYSIARVKTVAGDEKGISEADALR
jgi:hypothetical protein